MFHIILYKGDDNFTIITLLIEQPEQSAVSKRHYIRLKVRLYCYLPFTRSIPLSMFFCVGLEYQALW